MIRDNLDLRKKGAEVYQIRVIIGRPMLLKQSSLLPNLFGPTKDLFPIERNHFRLVGSLGRASMRRDQ